MKLLALAAAALVLVWAPRAPAASALSTVVPAVAQGVGATQRAVVVGAPLVSDITAPKGDDLVVRVAGLLAGKIGAGARAHGQPAPLAVARAVASKGGALVYLQLEIAHGALRATADVYPVLSNAWDRARQPAQPPRAHAFATAPLDAEIRTFLTPILLEQARTEKAKEDLGDVLAVACGDLDGDGGMELALATREKVAWGRMTRGSFVAEATASWATLAPRVPVPLRDVLATLSIVPRGDGGGGELFAGVSDRGGVLVGRNLLAGTPLSGLPLSTAAGLACGSVDAPASALASPLVPCRESAAGAGRHPAAARGHTVDATLVVPPTPRFDAFASTQIVARDGVARTLVATREPGGKLTLRLENDTLTIDSVGAQLAAADLDLDGTPEIVTSVDSADDAVTVSTWRGGELRPRLKLPAPGGVRALATCPPEQGGAPAVVAVVGAEVWVVR